MLVLKSTFTPKKANQDVVVETVGYVTEAHAEMVLGFFRNTRRSRKGVYTFCTESVDAIVRHEETADVELNGEVIFVADYVYAADYLESQLIEARLKGVNRK